VDRDANPRPFTPQVTEKDLRGLAVWTTGTDEDFKIWRWFIGPDLYPTPQYEYEEDKPSADRTD
jgi:hypothetical protein